MQAIVVLVDALAAVALERRHARWAGACALAAQARKVEEFHALRAMLVREQVHAGHEAQYTPADGPESQLCSVEEDHRGQVLNEWVLERQGQHTRACLPVWQGQRAEHPSPFPHLSHSWGKGKQPSQEHQAQHIPILRPVRQRAHLGALFA